MVVWIRSAVRFLADACTLPADGQIGFSVCHRATGIQPFKYAASFRLSTGCNRHAASHRQTLWLLVSAKVKEQHGRNLVLCFVRSLSVLVVRNADYLVDAIGFKLRAADSLSQSAAFRFGALRCRCHSPIV